GLAGDDAAVRLQAGGGVQDEQDGVRAVGRGVGGAGHECMAGPVHHDVAGSVPAADAVGPVQVAPSERARRGVALHRVDVVVHVRLVAVRIHSAGDVYAALAVEREGGHPVVVTRPVVGLPDQAAVRPLQLDGAELVLGVD